jgi:hypothetical protein
MQRNKPPSAAVLDEFQALLVLELAEGEAGESGFAAHALCRLASEEEAHSKRPDLPGFINELAENAADMGSRGVLSLEALDHTVDAASPHRELIETALRASILLGALAYKALMLARDHLPADPVPLWDPPSQERS